MTASRWGRLAAMFAVIAAINGAGWGIFLGYVLPHHFDYRGVGGGRDLGVGLGVAVTAWFLGFRHAFDADHISCIDNTTRKLMADGKRPLATGFFFSFGHSTVIVAVGVGITFAARAVFGAVVDPSSAYQTAGGTIGTLLSAGFLYLIAGLNVIVLAGIFKVFRRMRGGSYDEQELEAQLQARGLMYRFFGRFMKSVNHSWQLYFVGLVFGIGFDTTTEVVLLSATAYAAIQGLPYFAVLALPFLFSGGLMLLDTIDGCFMNFAYGWAFARPVRKVYYNLVITGLSIGAAFIIGTIEILGVLSSEINLHGAFWDLMANFNVNVAGFCIAGLFVVVWLAALVYWRIGDVEARWSAGLPAGQTRDPPDGSLPSMGQDGVMQPRNFSLHGAVDLGARQAAAQRREQAAQSGGPAANGGAVLEVTEETFNTEVVERSRTTPVILDLWAEWCGPCKQLSPVLEKLAAEANGQWMLAKVDVDANPQLSAALQVQSIPMVVAVVGGQLVDGFLGAMPEAQVRQWLTQVMAVAEKMGLRSANGTADEAPDEDQDAGRQPPGTPQIPQAYAEARAAMERGDLDGAARAFEAELARSPADQTAKAGLAQVNLIRRVSSYDKARARKDAAEHPDDVEAQIRVADIELASGRPEEAFDRLLGVVRRTSGEQRDQARGHLVSLFDVLPPRDPQVSRARSALSALLF